MDMRLEDLRRLRVQPGDTVVLRTPDRLSMEACERLREQVSAMLPRTVKTVVLEGGLDMAVVSATDARRIPDLLDANTRAHERNVALSAALAELLAACVEDFGSPEGEDDDEAVAVSAMVGDTPVKSAVRFGHLRRAEAVLKGNTMGAVDHG